MNPREHALLLRRRDPLNLIYRNFNGAVIHKVIIGAKLAFIAFKLIAHVGKALFQHNDGINAFCLGKKLQKTVIFGLKRSNARFGIHIIKRDVFLVLIAVGYVADSVNGA